MKIYKALICLFLALIIPFLLLAGCSTKKDASPQPEETTESPTSSKPYEPTGDLDPSYRDIFNENGLFKDIKALDYVDMFNYRAIEVPNERHLVSDEVLQSDIDSIMNGLSADNKIMNRAVVDHDRVNIDFVGSVNGIKFEGGSTGGAGTFATIGVDAYIEGFLEQLIGHMPGDSFEIKATFPDDYVEESLKGKEAVFDTTLNYIVDMRLTDHYVMANLSETYGWTNVDEMKDALSNDIKEYNIQQFVKEYFTTKVDIKSVPDEIVKYQENAMLDFYRGYAEYNGVDINTLISYEGFSNTDEFIDAYYETNYSNAASLLVVMAIAEDSGISVNEEDVAGYFAKYESSADYSSYAEQYGWPYLRHNVLCQKVMDYVVENAVLL